MGGLALIREAEAAGLSIRADGDKLVIRGPRQAEPIARKLIAHKPAVLSVLRQPTTEPAPIIATISEDATDWREFFEERAAIRQYEAAIAARWPNGSPMANASKGGGSCTVARICPGLCAGCGEPLARRRARLARWRPCPLGARSGIHLPDCIRLCPEASRG